jgi:hypothetical protein
VAIERCVLVVLLLVRCDDDVCNQRPTSLRLEDEHKNISQSNSMYDIDVTMSSLDRSMRVER